MSERRSVITEQPFSDAITPSVVINSLRNEGALLIRGFIPEPAQQAIVDEVLLHDLTPVDRSNHTIPEQFNDIGWKFKDAPPQVVKLGQQISRLVRPELPQWFTNHVRAQLYSPGEVGVEWHRDYSRDIRVIAVASLLKTALFEAKLDTHDVKWEVEPGDVVFLRGTGLTGNADDRPYHRVEAPKSGKRLSVAYRQVVTSPPKLEPNNV